MKKWKIGDVFTALMVMLFFIVGASLDGQENLLVPIIVMIVSAAWCCGYYYINAERILK